MFITQICGALSRAKIPYAIVGGYAVALHGAIRGTVDIDVAIQWTLKNLEKAEAALKELGLVSLIPVHAEQIFHFREEYIKNKHLVAWNFYDPKNPANQVDIIITYDLHERSIKTIDTVFGKVRVLSRKDLIEMKKKSRRPQDLEDVKSLESL